MLFLLLDEHISPVVAEQISHKRPEIQIFTIHSWQEGKFLGLSDEAILQAATKARMTLVTYDQKTIPPLLCEWGQSGIFHQGVIFIDYHSIPPSNFGALVRSLIWLWDTQNNMNWKNRLVYLQPQF